MKKKKISQKIGTGLARIQHEIDALFEWGFSELKKTGKEDPKKDESAVISNGKKVLSFFGEMGNEYYKSYEELKKKKEKKTK